MQFAFAAFATLAGASGQTSGITPEEYLLKLPAPALDAEEAMARCPQEADTSLQKILKELSLRAESDTADTSVSGRQLRLQTKYFTHAQKEFARELFAAGEHVDKEIRACPKELNDKGQRVYNPECVEAAEQLGTRRRIAAVDHYLSGIHQLWADYMSATRTILANANEGKWLIVLRAAANAATITQTAAQFAR